MHHGSPQLVDWSNPINNHPLNNGLAAWWMAVPGRQGWRTTVWRDLCGRFDGTLTNMDASTDWGHDRPIGGWGSLAFDGSSEYVELGDIDSDVGITSEASVSFILKTDQYTGGLARLSVADGSGETYYPFNGDYLYVGLLCGTNERPISNANNSSFDRSKWHLLTVTAKTGTGNYKLYQNGMLSASGTMTADPSLNYSSSRIGGSSGQHLTGEISAVILHNRYLQQQEVLELYRQSQQHYRDLLRRRTPRTTMYVPETGGGGFSPWYRKQQSRIIGMGIS